MLGVARRAEVRGRLFRLEPLSDGENVIFQQKNALIFGLYICVIGNLCIWEN